MNHENPVTNIMNIKKAGLEARPNNLERCYFHPERSKVSRVYRRFFGRFAHSEWQGGDYGTYRAGYARRILAGI